MRKKYGKKIETAGGVSKWSVRWHIDTVKFPNELFLDSWCLVRTQRWGPLPAKYAHVHRQKHTHTKSNWNFNSRYFHITCVSCVAAIDKFIAHTSLLINSCAPKQIRYQISNRTSNCRQYTFESYCLIIQIVRTPFEMPT